MSGPEVPPGRPEDARRQLEPGVGAELQLSVQSLETSVKDTCGEAGRAEGLERAATRRRRLVIWAVALLCLAGALQGILVNGLINVVISSIEKRFGIKSSDSGFIANSYDIASFLCLLPVSYLGGRGSGRKPAWIGAGVAVLGIGSLLFSLPHLLAGPVARAGGLAGGPSGTLCGDAKHQVGIVRGLLSHFGGDAALSL
jgi:organic anion transporter 4A